MSIEIGGKKPRAVDFTFEGKALFVRQLPLRLGLKIQGVAEDDSLPAEIVAEIIAECVVFEDGSKCFDVDRVLDFDTREMMELFGAVSSDAEESTKNAGKN
jgi:hypothetical protein